MAAGQHQDIVAVSNQTFRATLTIQNLDGTPVDLTGYTGLRMQWRQAGDAAASPTLDLEQVTSSGAQGLMLSSTPVDGTIGIMVTAASLAGVAGANAEVDFADDVIGTAPSGDAVGLAWGCGKILLGVTR